MKIKRGLPLSKQHLKDWSLILFTFPLVIFISKCAQSARLDQARAPAVTAGQASRDSAAR